MDNYTRFLKGKTLRAKPHGINTQSVDFNAKLYEFQRVCVEWALRRGRAALFQDCGLGKTPEQLEWARVISESTNAPVLILAPLAVSQQTVREGKKFGIQVRHVRDGADVKPGINVTNYEMLQHFDPAGLGGIVLDESSILKAFAGKVRRAITDFAGRVQYRLACTATPAPNDFMEIGTHSEFVSAMPRPEMLSTFFVHDSSGGTDSWRLKGHGARPFWKWVAQWAIACRTPSDLGFPDDGYILPPLKLEEHVVTSMAPDGYLFAMEARGLQERRVARRDSIGERVELAAELATKTKRPFLLWCNLNAESEALAKAIPDAEEVRGADSRDRKEELLLAFAARKIRVLVTKPRIAGFGLNWQHCSDMAFVGLSDSYEQFYQALRRCWRFGQKRSVRAHIVISEAEGAILANIRRKERLAGEMFTRLVEHMNLAGQMEWRTQTVYKPRTVKAPQWMNREVKQ